MRPTARYFKSEANSTFFGGLPMFHVKHCSDNSVLYWRAFQTMLVIVLLMHCSLGASWVRS
jgi:hypothetical protein